MRLTAPSMPPVMFRPAHQEHYGNVEQDQNPHQEKCVAIAEQRRLLLELPIDEPAGFVRRRHRVYTLMSEKRRQLRKGLLAHRTRSREVVAEDLLMKLLAPGHHRSHKRNSHA